MKKLAGLCFVFLAFAESAYAGCRDKCVIRNPFNGKCAYELRVCPLSVETVGNWLDGATPDTLADAFKDIDPTKMLSAIGSGIGFEGLVTDKVTGCMVSLAAAGTFGEICAAGVAAIGPACLAEVTCVGSCAASVATFKNGLEDCSIEL